MDRRLHERVTVQFEAKVTKLSEVEQSTYGRVSDISNSGLSVVIPIQLAPGDLIRLEMADSVLNGHVIYSKTEGCLFRTGIEVEQVLLGDTGLSQLLQRTLRETMSGAPGLEPSETQIC